jgi:hypothetical protein
MPVRNRLQYPADGRLHPLDPTMVDERCGAWACCGLPPAKNHTYLTDPDDIARTLHR